MYKPVLTRRFEKDYKKASKRGKDLRKIKAVMSALLKSQLLPEKNRDHALKGNYRGYRECHIEPDWLLIYIVDDQTSQIIFERTGSHSDLF